MANKNELEKKFSQLNSENKSKALDYIDYLLTKSNKQKLVKLQKSKDEVVLKEYTMLDFSPTRLMRIAKNLTIHELAALLNFSPSYIYSIECGDRQISDSFITTMLATFNIEYTDYVKLEKYINRVLRFFCDINLFAKDEHQNIYLILPRLSAIVGYYYDEVAHRNAITEYLEKMTIDF